MASTLKVALSQLGGIAARSICTTRPYFAIAATHTHHGSLLYLLCRVHSLLCVHLYKMEKRSRRSAAKVKTGCKTCKYVHLFATNSLALNTACGLLICLRVRRIKCDEGRPSCLKCVLPMSHTQLNVTLCALSDAPAQAVSATATRVPKKTSKFRSGVVVKPPASKRLYPCCPG
jgi:hypothetical protein